MSLKKFERYSALWRSCDELRGGMDASQCKDYVPVLLFAKYISEKYASQPDALLGVPSVGLCPDIVARKGDREIDDRVNKLIGIGQANSASQNIYNPIYCSGSLPLKVHDEAYDHTAFDLTLYGQEMENPPRR